MLEKEFNFYLKNQEALLKEYKGKFLVIQGENVVDVFASEEEAFLVSSEKYEPGSFLIQLCEEGEGAFTETYYSRVAI